MISIPKELYHLKFIEYLESLEVLYFIDNHFKLICDEYCRSKQNADICDRKIEKFFYHILKEENLSKELEEEIVIYILKKS
ncbi:hypothetical protein CLU81_0610 [Flavobacterium sp. 9]|uniref:hypothetical protein n=1 Tax=Flavobacterium sp. 9 TaxID=2035198 RepID=UPI000C18EAB2|nr:hypothetical protein [Flavobacterium sp. 9]PIF30199.1 hypothetical protein CLU81_0610 [Flavobacterium sp. 9]